MKFSKIKGKNKKKWVKWGILGVALLILIAIMSGFFKSGIVVSTETIKKGDISEVIEETGTVFALDNSLIVASSNFKILNVNYKVGDKVKKDDILIETDLKSNEFLIKSMQAELNGLNQQYLNTKNRASQLKELYQTGGVSKNSYLDMKVESETLEHKMQSLRFNIENLKNNDISSEIKSPRDGIVTETYISNGDNVIMGSKLIEVSDMNTAYIQANLISEDVAKIKLGNKVILKDYPDIFGTINKIHPKIKSEVSELGISRKRAIVEVNIDNPEKFILGADLDVQIVVKNKNDVILANKKSVIEIGEKYFVYLIKNSKIDMQEVEVGLKGETHYEIIKGLEEDEIVVVSPNKKLKSGDKIKKK